MAEKRNQAFVRTHERIKGCLGELLKTKQLRQITVGEICEAVEVNRSTFYAHFTDIYAVAEAISEDYNIELGAKFAELANSGEPLNEREYIITLLEHVKERRVFYRRLIADTSSQVVVNNMMRIHKELVTPIYKRFNMDKRTADYCYEFTMAGFFTVIGKWINDGCPETPEEMAGLILNIMPSAPGGKSLLDLFSDGEQQS